jgi:hypothetical protein
MKHVRWRVLTSCTAVASVVLLAAACGSGTTSVDAPATGTRPATAASAASDPIRPCSYITKAEAEGALGIPLQDPREGAYNPVSLDAACEFDSAGELQTLALSVRITNLVDQAASIQRLEDLMGGDRQPVEGLGDRAFVALSQLFVFKGGRQVTVIVTAIVRPQDKRVEAREAIARMVVERL